MEERDLMFVVTSKDVDAGYICDLKPALQEFAKYPAEGSTNNCKTSRERASICRRSLTDVLWKSYLYRRVQERLVVVVTQTSRAPVLRSLHSELGHWGLKGTQALVSDRFWWPKVLGDVARYVKTCDTCQRMKSLKSYAT